MLEVGTEAMGAWCWRPHLTGGVGGFRGALLEEAGNPWGLGSAWGLTGKEGDFQSFKKKKTKKTKKHKHNTTFQGVKAMCSVQTWPQCGRKSPDFGVHLSCRNRGQCSGQSTFLWRSMWHWKRLWGGRGWPQSLCSWAAPFWSFDYFPSWGENHFSPEISNGWKENSGVQLNKKTEPN